MENKKLEVQLFQRRGAHSNWPLPGENITYRLKGNKLPEPELEKVSLIENLGGAGRRTAPCYFKSLRILGQEEGITEYELTLITVEAWQSVKEEAGSG